MKPQHATPTPIPPHRVLVQQTDPPTPPNPHTPKPHTGSPLAGDTPTPPYAHTPTPPYFHTPARPHRNDDPATLEEVKRRIAREEVAEGIAGGLSITRACDLAGVTRQTFYNWLDTDESFRRLVAFAEEVNASSYEADLVSCADKAVDDPRYQRALTYYLERRERRRERQADREHRADLLRMKLEHERRMAQEAHARTASAVPPQPIAPPAAVPAPVSPAEPLPPPPPDTPTPALSLLPHRVPALAGDTPTPDTPAPASRPLSIYRPDSKVPLHLRPFRHLYHAAPGPIKRPEPLPSRSYTGDGHTSALPSVSPDPPGQVKGNASPGTREAGDGEVPRSSGEVKTSIPLQSPHRVRI